jgi:hypothetical protein
MITSSAMRTAGLAATLLASLAACSPDNETAPKEAACAIAANQPQLADVVTSVAFNPKVLGEIGVTIQSSGAIKAAPQHPLSILPAAASSFDGVSECMAVDVVNGHLRGFTSGRITHAGGPALTYGKSTVDLAGFELRVGAEPRTFEVYSASGEHVLTGTLPHYNLDPTTNVLDVFNVDLAASSALAAKWGAPQLAGTVVGTLTMHAKLAVPALGVSSSALSIGGKEEVPANACNDFSGQVDVALTQMDQVQQQGRVGDKVIITPSAVLKNVGTANVPWQSRFSGFFPPYNIDQHPFLVWALYREVGGVFEGLAYSDVKHAFLTINSNCAPGACTIGSVLGLGCEDVYGVGTNGTHLAPRSEILPKAGTWAHCGFPTMTTPSHFDQVAPFCQQDNNGGNESTLEHRAVASDAELAVPGANYYFASWYVVRDDINIFNSMGWRKIVPTRNGNTWTFGLNTPYRQGSVLDAWVDPAAPSNTRLNITYKDPTAGSTQLAVTATDLGNGKHRYVYALHNHDFDPKISSIIIPMAEGTTIEQPKFSDGDEDTNNDWIRDIGMGQIAWTASSIDTRLSWGKMITISFVANAAPGRGTARVIRSDNGRTLSIKSISVGAPSF